jgi:NodT family efflux transporter outer membrane factor (OMF) lipoprotein
MVGPDFVRPQAAVASKWLGGEPGVQSEPAQYRTWWKVFKDSSLDGIIDRAYRENLTLQTAGVRVLQARAQLGIAAGGLYPQSQQAAGSLAFTKESEESFFSAFGGGTSAASGTAGGGESSAASRFPLSYWQDQVNLGASWEIDFWGRFRRNVQSADANLRASVADYDGALVSLTADAANAYIQIRTLQKRLEIAQQNVEVQKEGNGLARIKFQGGLTTELDLQLSNAQLSNTQATVPTLEAQLRQAEDALSVLLGLPPGNIAEILGGPAPIPVAPAEVAVGIPADLLRRRPDVRAAELQAAAQCAQIGVAKADLYPAFTLSGTIGLLSTTIGTAGLSNLFNGKALTASAGPSFAWNLFNYGRITNNVRVQDALFQQLLLNYQNTVLSAQQQVQDSLAGFLGSRKNAELLAQSVQSAKIAAELALAQYQLGSADFTTVVTAQQSLLTAQDSLARAVGSTATNLVGLFRALGGGWEIRRGQPLVPSRVAKTMAQRTDWGDLLRPQAYLLSSPGPGPDVRPPDW